MPAIKNTSSMTNYRVFILIGLLLFIQKAIGQTPPVNEALLTKTWPACWIQCPGSPERDYGVYHFRKSFALKDVPTHFVVHVSADNRYRLFVNGKAVCNGPARGDLYNWYFETIDIASCLQPGKNLISALVWNMGTLAPVAQVSNRTAFLLQSNDTFNSFIDTDTSWKVWQNQAYKPCSADNGQRLNTYMVIGPGDEVDAGLYPYGWETAAFNDAGWQQAACIANAVTNGHGTDNLWTLQPRNIPLMEESLQRMANIRRTTGITVMGNFLIGNQPLTISANTTASILIDNGVNTVAYPEMIVSGGKGAVIKITYAEALMKDGVKGNRDSIEGKTILGNYDIFKPDGGRNRLFRPLWLRGYRYIQLDITTSSEPVQINDLYGMYTGYPFTQQASFGSNDTSLKAIWDVGWRTARLCAGETYYDCPYYEQLQYEGDTRIQSFISLYVTGDDRLMRKAIADFYNSRIPDGLTQGRYPSNRLQVIPPFSLYWVSMVYDYWMHRKDDAFIQPYLHAIQGVLGWFEQHVDQKKNMLGALPWWNFTDWDTAFDFGVPDGAASGHSSIITLQYAYTLQQAAKLMAGYGNINKSRQYDTLAARLCKGTYSLCFSNSKMAMANTPDKKTYSQHAGIMGVLSGAVPPVRMKQVMRNVLRDTGMSQATFYYRFYLTQALKKAGLANMYYSQLQPWRGMLVNGLTTFAENPDPTRSDCHAWSASPLYDFLATICGIMPASPGFETVLVQPAFGELHEIKGSMPHPLGAITVHLKLASGKQISGSVTLPKGVTGTFLWNGKMQLLMGGSNTIRI